VTEHEKMEFWNSPARLYDETLALKGDCLALKDATSKLAEAACERYQVASAHERRLDKIEVVQCLAEQERAREMGEQS
jgi:hypothetical protein